LSNAVKFTPARGRVDVVGRLVNGCARVAVRDTGIGIPAEDHGRIFEEFQQAGSAAGRAPEGTGLGLALARRFVELHGGALTLESQVGLGSTFTFSIPTTRAHATPAAGLQPADADDSSRQQTVLLIEDNPQAADLLTLHLESDGFTVIAARDGDSGLALARERHPAAIVLDILLPRVDGWDVVARARADPTVAEIPVVIVTMLDERAKGFALGAADYLVKPVQRESLVASVRRVTSQQHETVALAVDQEPWGTYDR
jgi:CheY-like chemotaxis protein